MKELRDRLLRVAIAAAAAILVSWPLAGFHVDAAGEPSASLGPALRIGLVVLGVGVAYALALEAWRHVPRARLPRLPAAGSPEGGAGLVLLVAALAAVPGFASRSWVSNLCETFTLATIALGLNITIGMAGLLVLGHAAFWSVGAYAFTLLVVRCEWNFWLAFPAAGLAAGLVGFAVGLPALRLRGDYLAIVTLGFGEVVRLVLKNQSALTGGDAGIPGSEVPGDVRAVHGPAWLWQPRTIQDCYWFALALLVACVVAVTLLSRSRFGRALFALREDETAAKCMGIDTVRVKLLAFASSAMWAGLAGVVTPIFRGQITPDLFDFNQSVLVVAMVVIGGLGSIPGSIAGAALLFLLPLLLRQHIPEIQEYRMLVFGAVLAAMMVVRPQGLFGASGRGGETAEEPA